MEHKNFMKQSQVLIAILTKQKRISEIEDQLNEVKEDKIRKKKEWKEVNKPYKKYGIMWKDLIYIW